MTRYESLLFGIYRYIPVYTGIYQNNDFHPGGQDSRWYERHIPVISLDPTWCHIDGTYRHIPVIWHRELTSHMNHIWQFMPVIWLVAWEQAAPGAPARSRIALEMQRHTEFGLQGCLLCQCITQRVGATGQPSRRRWGKPALQKTTQVATKSHRRRRQQW